MKRIILGTVAIILVGFFIIAMMTISVPSMGGKIAVIKLKGQISSSPILFYQSVVPESVIPMIETVKSDPSVKVVLFKINSPGGFSVQKMKPLRAPTDLFLELTSACNLRCQHCNVYPFRQDPDEFTFDEWIRFFDRLVELKVFTVWVSGGEPLARPDMLELLEARVPHYEKAGLIVEADANYSVKDMAEKVCAALLAHPSGVLEKV